MKIVCIYSIKKIIVAQRVFLYKSVSCFAMFYSANNTLKSLQMSEQYTN